MDIFDLILPSKPAAWSNSGLGNGSGLLGKSPGLSQRERPCEQAWGGTDENVDREAMAESRLAIYIW